MIDKQKENSKATHTAHGEAQRRALTEAAFQLIAEGGFENLRTRDVAARAGVNIATLHYYFATKEDLIRAVSLLLIEQFSQPHYPLAAGPPNALEDVRQELHDIDYQIEHTPALNVVLFELLMRSFRDAAARAMMEELTDHWQTDHLEGLLRGGVEQGVFRADLDVPAAAVVFSAFMVGFTSFAMLYPDRMPNERVFAEIERWLVAP